MKATVVIPVYNTPHLLTSALSSLRVQDVDGKTFDVLVVDHGSNDDIRAVVEAFSGYLELNYCRIPREGYGAATPRNVGIELAGNDVIIMIDADMIVCPQFVRSHLAAHARLGEGVAIGYIFGLGWSDDAEQWAGNESLVDQLSYSKFFRELRQHPKLLDWREPQWLRVNNSLMRLPAPWGHFWTGNVSVHRKAFSAVGPFDTKYHRAEDVDMGYRLYQAGFKFELAAAAETFHIPHRINRSQYEEFQEADYARFVCKYPCLEVETYVSATDQLDPNAVYSEIYALQDRSLLNDYPPCRPSEIIIANIERPCLLIGCGAGSILQWISVDAAVELSYVQWLLAKQHSPEIMIYNLIGSALPFEKKYFSSGMITDYWRFLPPDTLRLILREVTRVARRVFLLIYPEWGQLGLSKNELDQSLRIRLGLEFDFEYTVSVAATPNSCPHMLVEILPVR